MHTAKTPSLESRSSKARPRGTTSTCGSTEHAAPAPGNQTMQGLLDTGAIQAKLALGHPNDPSEHEADRVAARVVRMREPPVAGACASCGGDGSPCPSCGAGRKPPVQRRVSGVSPSAQSAPDNLLGSLGPGMPLAPAARAFFEPRFGRDFSDVRVHANPQAAQAAGSIDAKAFTAGRSIAFGAGHYAPETPGGRELLAHELAHVVQQTGVVRRQPNDPPGGKAGAEDRLPVKPTSAAIKDVIAFYKKLPPTDIKQYYVVDGNRLTVYDKDGKRKETFELHRPGLIDVTGYYLGNPFFEVGWAWISRNAKGDLGVTGLTRAGMREIKKPSEIGKTLQALNQELIVLDWIKDADVNRFWKSTDRGPVAMAIMNTPIKARAAAGKEGPVLSFHYPAWFKALKTKVEARIDADRAADKTNPVLPQSISFYGSDRVQAQRGADAWTIQVNKDKRAAYLTIQKKSWDDADDKDAYAQQITQELYKKVKLILDDVALKKQEQKEITDIDGTGGKKKGSKWAWAFALKKRIEALLAREKLKERGARDFPDKLTLSTQDVDQEAHAYLRVWIYKDDKDAKPDALPQLSGGTLPTALKEDDKAEYWAPIVRKAAEALRSGRVSTEKGAEGADVTKADFTTLPPYPALVHPYDLNPDLTTATIASNTFRMVVDIAAVHGTDLLNLTTIRMGMNIGYSWGVYPLPEELKREIAGADRPSTKQLQKLSTEYVRKNNATLGAPKETYKPDYDWDQSVTMNDLGVGQFLMVGKASIAYPSDMKIKRAPSVAALPFTVKTAEELAAESAFADSNTLKRLKDELAKETDPRKKRLLMEQIKDLEAREGTDLLTQTRKDEAETLRLIKKAGELKKFIQDDRKRKLSFSGGRDYDPFMFRLKAFDKDLYALYILVRQVYDYRYDDLHAIDEYTKQVKKQYDDLHKLELRTVRMTKNEKLRKDLPEYQSVAALVKEEDGNLVPLILVAGHHADSKPEENKYKMMLFDVTFDSPKKGDMTYVGDDRSTEKDAVKSAFVEFGDDNKYGNGKIAYSIPQKGYKDKVDSVTTFTEYLGYALAVIGVVLLVAGTILSAGTLAPASAGAIGAIVTALGISAGVAGAVLAGRNIYKRVEKGTFELDAEFALDVVAIIGAAVQVLGTVGRLATLTRGVGALQRVVQIQRLDRLLVIYDAVELGGNVVLVGLKVKEDVEAVKALHLPPEQEDEMMQQIAMEAVQQGAMLAFATFGKVKDLSEHLQARIENSRYRSFRERGWVDEHGMPTEDAPPFLREHVTEPGKAPSRAAQAEQAWKETQVLDLAHMPTEDGQHKLTVTENGRIIRCSDFCTDLRLQYGEILREDPWLNSQMAELEVRAKKAAGADNKAEAAKVADDAAVLEGKLKQADDLRKHLFGMTNDEINAALDSIESGKVTGGAKSGHKIDDVRMPKRQRRQIDVADIMTEAELKELGKGGYKKALDRMNKVMGKKISDIPELKKAWDAARTEVLKGKEPTDYSRKTVIGMYKKAQRKFWENVRKDPAAVEFLKQQGFELKGHRGAALAELGPQGKTTTRRGHITNQERRISLDHIEEKAQGDNWKKALDADNLELMFQNANSWKEIVQVKFGMRDKEP